MSASRFVSPTLMAALAGVATGALAHHGWTGYDDDNPLELSGTVISSSYAHPHGSIELETPRKTWSVVLAPPSRMQRRGLSAEMLAPGVEVTVVGYPHRTEDSELRAERIMVDGKTIELR